MTGYRHVLICVPSTGQVVRSATAMALANAAKELQAMGIRADLHNIDSAEIVTARDMFANMVLHSPNLDGLLFVDSDMAFEPRLVRRMVGLGEDLVAAAYVRRALNINKLVSAAAAGADLAKATASASSFTLIPHWDQATGKQLEVNSGFASMAAVGMGCALISRRALEAMVAEKVVRERRDLNASGGEACWSFFEPIEHNGTRLGEDYSFCHRWTSQLKRKLWVCIDETLGHIGAYQFQGRYADLVG